MMAADVFAAFEEQGLGNEEQLAVVGQRQELKTGFILPV